VFFNKRPYGQKEFVMSKVKHFFIEALNYLLVIVFFAALFGGVYMWGVSMRVDHTSQPIALSTIADYKAANGKPSAKSVLLEKILADDFYGETVDVSVRQEIKPFLRSGNNGKIYDGNACDIGVLQYHYDKSKSKSKNDGTWWWNDDEALPIQEEQETIQVRGSANGLVLYEYTTSLYSTGMSCHSSMLFFGKDLIAKNKSFTEEQIEEKKLVAQLLAKEFYGEPVDSGDWHWIDAVNVEPTSNWSSHNNLSYGERCGIGSFNSADDEEDGFWYGIGNYIFGSKKGGTIQVRGETNDKVLYEYTSYGRTGGTGCPSGVLFFSEDLSANNI